MLTFNGETRSFCGWERHLGLPVGVVSSRMGRGWPVERALAVGLSQYAKPSGPKSHAWAGGRILLGPEGYVGIYMPQHPRANKQGYVREHVLIASNALGRPVPRSAVVHHVDENITNNANDNLVICPDNKYHFMLHVRMRVRAAGGHPDKDKICAGCKACMSKDLFWARKSSYDLKYAYCIDCGKAKNSRDKSGRKSREAQ